jgi:hypothetical protein
MRNQSTTEPTERRNPFHKERRPRRQYEKPLWQIEKEREQQELEEKKKEAERGLENTMENFPTLGKATAGTSTIWSGSRKFSELASDWKIADEKRKEEEERLKASGQDDRNDVFQLPRFRNVHRFGEPEDEYYEEAPEEAPEEVPTEEKWVLVDSRKYRKPKREPDFNEDDFDECQEEDGTVWNAQEEHETCWDEQRH